MLPDKPGQWSNEHSIQHYPSDNIIFKRSKLRQLLDGLQDDIVGSNASDELHYYRLSESNIRPSGSVEWKVIGELEHDDDEFLEFLSAWYLVDSRKVWVNFSAITLLTSLVALIAKTLAALPQLWCLSFDGAVGIGSVISCCKKAETLHEHCLSVTLKAKLYEW